MRPRLAEFGITRLARLTGLDEVGIPVWAAIRPNAAHARRVARQGRRRRRRGRLGDDGGDRGRHRRAARSAAPDPVAARDGGLRAPRGAADELLRVGASPPAADEPIDWIEGFDLMDDAPVWVPLDAVRLGEEAARGALLAIDRRSRLGQRAVGSGVSRPVRARRARRADAVVARGDAEVGERCRDPRDFDDPELAALAAKIEAAGLRLRLFDISTDVAIPVCFATISPPPDSDPARWRHFDLQSGSGCHPDPARAAIRAVTEAAQSRLTAISGARDDFDPGDYRARIALDLLPFVQAEPSAGAPGRRRGRARRLHRPHRRAPEGGRRRLGDRRPARGRRARLRRRQGAGPRSRDDSRRAPLSAGPRALRAKLARR